ncbi:MAG: GTP-binding protein [Fimbriimonas sp.]
MDVLRFATAGSVDDGKSSLIGRLLYDSKNLFDDQLEAVQRASHQRGSNALELALLTDGLRAEREQNITIDVAYRYFSTPRRKFIIADTPGHLQYTRNMVTGVSRVDLSVILVDATKGILPQSKRHTAVSSALGVPRLVAAINKMDLVGYDQSRFEELAEEFRLLAAKFGSQPVDVIPVSALLGDNVVDASPNLAWFQGPTLLGFLESVTPNGRDDSGPFRMFVQHVIRSNGDYRGLAGRPSAGSIQPGERVTLLPGGQRATVTDVRGPDGLVKAGRAGEAMSLRLAENIDVSRGTLVVRSGEEPTEASELSATVCWMSERTLGQGNSILIAHGTRRVFATVVAIESRIEIETLREEPAEGLENNDLGRVRLRTLEPIYVEPYAGRRETGALLIIDPASLITVGAGMVDAVHAPFSLASSGAGSMVSLWGAGSRHLAERIRQIRPAVVILDEREAEGGVNSDRPASEEAIRRLNEIAKLLVGQGLGVLLIRSAEHPGGFEVPSGDDAIALAQILNSLPG